MNTDSFLRLTLEGRGLRQTRSSWGRLHTGEASMLHVSCDPIFEVVSCENATIRLRCHGLAWYCIT
jgi:hypothetical protein